MRASGLACCAVLFASSDALAMPSLATARQNACAATLGERVYVIGGQGEQGFLASVEAFDGTRWSPAASLPRPLCCQAVVSWGSSIYLFGGLGTTGVERALLAFDPVGRRWESLPPMPRARKNAGAFLWRGRIGVVGGSDQNGNPVAEIDVFDPSARTWNTLEAKLPTPRESVATGVVNGELVVAGGFPADDLYGVGLVERFSFPERVWRVGPPLAEERGQAAFVSLPHALLVAGGWTPFGVSSTVEWVGDFSLGWQSWTGLATPRAGAAAALWNGQILVMGGGEYLGGGQWRLLGSVESLGAPP